MRKIDRRAQFSRRSFLRTTGAALPVALVAGASISADAAWAANAKNIEPHDMATLVKMARDIYPHDRVGDVFYVNAVTPWDAKADKDETVKSMVAGGVARLDQDAQSKFGLESVQDHFQPLQSLRSMSRTDAHRRNASAFWLRHSQSFARRRQRFSHAMVRSTIQRLGSTTNLPVSQRRTISTFTSRQTRAKPCRNFGP